MIQQTGGFIFNTKTCDSSAVNLCKQVNKCFYFTKCQTFGVPLTLTFPWSRSLSAAWHQWTWAGLGKRSRSVHHVCQTCVWGVLSASKCFSTCTETNHLHVVFPNIDSNFCSFIQTKKYADVIIPRGVDNLGECFCVWSSEIKVCWKQT